MALVTGTGEMPQFVDPPESPDSGPSRRAVLITDFRHVGISFADLAPVLLEGGGRWLERMQDQGQSAPAGWPARAAHGMPRPLGTTVSAIVHIGAGPELLRPIVVVTLGAARSHPERVVVPLRWEPLAGDRILPDLEGDLELADAGEGFSRLSLSGRFHVPLAEIGWRLHQLALHRVAEASLRRFLQDVEEALVAEGAS